MSEKIVQLNEEVVKGQLKELVPTPAKTARKMTSQLVLYEYQPSRKAEHAAKFLEGFSGYLHADSYRGYHKLPGKTQPRAQRSGSRLERRSKGASAVFAIGGNGVERTLRRRAAGRTPGGNLTRP